MPLCAFWGSCFSYVVSECRPEFIVTMLQYCICFAMAPGLPWVSWQSPAWHAAALPRRQHTARLRLYAGASCGSEAQPFLQHLAPGTPPRAAYTNQDAGDYCSWLLQRRRRPQLGKPFWCETTCIDAVILSGCANVFQWLFNCLLMLTVVFCCYILCMLGDSCLHVHLTGHCIVLALSQQYCMLFLTVLVCDVGGMQVPLVKNGQVCSQTWQDIA